MAEKKDYSNYNFPGAAKSITEMYEAKAAEDAKNADERKKMFDSAVESVKGLGKRIKENVMGTPEQNEKAKKEMAEQDAKNPDTTQAKVNRMLKPEGKKKGGKISSYKSGGSVSSASKRADGCAIKGKTKGRMV
jgi:hypothetical protein